MTRQALDPIVIRRAEFAFAKLPSLIRLAMKPQHWLDHTNLEQACYDATLAELDITPLIEHALGLAMRHRLRLWRSFAPETYQEQKQQFVEQAVYLAYPLRCWARLTVKQPAAEKLHEMAEDMWDKSTFAPAPILAPVPLPAPVHGPMEGDSELDAGQEVAAGACVICYANPVTHGFLHLGSVHACACMTCARRIDDGAHTVCPICRAPNCQVIEVFSSSLA